jgi:peptidoglycan/xylan/chitin deacetylase (PgdA/CDA1 family)
MIPILMYHNVGPWSPSFTNENRALTVKPEDFAAQMEFLSRNGFTPITLKELHQMWKNDRPMPEKPIVLTFDDGDHNVYQYAYPIAKRHGFPFVVFLITRWTPVNTTFYMSKSEVSELVGSGLVELGSHTKNHVNLGEASLASTFYEIRESKKEIRGLFGYEATSFCYPFGEYTRAAMVAMRFYGYTMATTTITGMSNETQSPYLLRRIKIDGTEAIQDFIARVTRQSTGQE